MEDFIDIDSFSCQYDTNQLLSFDNISFENVSNDKIIDNLYDKKYSHTTMEYYKAMRIRKMDPISMQDIKSDNFFAFKYMWDSYTGERLGEDPNGPLYFDPHNLIKYFYTNRLNGLWVEPVDDHGGYYEGYYDDGIGCGEDMFVHSRGYHPERYLFRLPIIDCYLTDDHNNSIITMGPKLTDEEIKLIEELSKQNKDNYKNLFGKEKPNLINMKKIYDQAISKTPKIDNHIITDNTTNDQLKELYNKANRKAVDSLVHMKG
jgi:hypothetical protein